MRTLSPLLITVLLLAGCERSGSSLSPEANEPFAPARSPGLSFIADRSTAEFNLVFAADGYALFIGVTLEQVIGICEGRLPPVPTWNQLTVIRPEGRDDFEESLKQLSQAKDLPITIFEFSLPPFGHECDLLGAPHYTGTGQAIVADNDVSLTHNGANAFNLRVTGAVTDDSGQPYHLVARVLGVLSRETESLNGFLKIRLTPIGG
jgi:hypothetical protein